MEADLILSLKFLANTHWNAAELTNDFHSQRLIKNRSCFLGLEAMVIGVLYVTFNINLEEMMTKRFEKGARLQHQVYFREQSPIVGACKRAQQQGKTAFTLLMLPLNTIKRYYYPGARSRRCACVKSREPPPPL